MSSLIQEFVVFCGFSEKKQQASPAYSQLRYSHWLWFFWTKVTLFLILGVGIYRENIEKKQQKQQMG